MQVRKPPKSISDVNFSPGREDAVIRVAIFDDHPIMRDGIVNTFEREDGFVVVGQGGSCEEAIRITELHLPDLIVLDISMPGGGVEAAKTLSRTCPAVRIIMLTAHDSEQHVVDSMRSGATGYLVKGVSSDELVKTARAIMNGEGYVSPGLAARLLGKRSRNLPSAQAHNKFMDLTIREEEILRFVCEGQSNREIGEHLGLTEKTIKHYMTNILQKLHARNRVEAAVIGKQRLGNSS